MILMSSGRQMIWAGFWNVLCKPLKKWGSHALLQTTGSLAPLGLETTFLFSACFADYMASMADGFCSVAGNWASLVDLNVCAHFLFALFSPLAPLSFPCVPRSLPTLAVWRGCLLPLPYIYTEERECYVIRFAEKGRTSEKKESVIQFSVPVVFKLF